MTKHHAPARRSEPSIQFLGATGTVTGSKFLLRTINQNWLVDCGLFQGLKDLRVRNWAPLPVKASDIDGVILTHAHIDHSGYVPMLCKQQFHGKIFGSEPTVDLCKILLPDAGFLQEEDARYASRKGYSKHPTAMPLYTHQDAMRCLSQLEPLHSDGPHTLGDLHVSLHKAGHLLGSRFIDITLEHPRRRRILFAGDIGRYDSLITVPPLRVPEADYLILEATYGGRKHPKEDIFERIAGIINRAASGGGKVLIPAFAVGRTQELLYIIRTLQQRKMIPAELPIYLNTPLGIGATDIYARYIDEHKMFSGLSGQIAHGANDNPFQCDNLHYVHTQEQSKGLNDLRGGAVIIAGSGMMTGGRILHHLRTYGPDANSCLVLVGYQAEGTRGRAILDGARSLKMHGESIPIRCHVEVIESLSAHGDQEDILRWLSGFSRPPRQTYLVHGETERAEALALAIRERLHWNVHIPRYLEEVMLH